MSDIARLTVNGETYDIHDSRVDTLVTSAMRYVGQTVTYLTDGCTTDPIIVDGASHTAVTGDVVIYGTSGTEGAAPKEFIWNGSKWNEFGSTGSLKALAFKDSAGGTFVPVGTVSAPAFTPATTTKSLCTGGSVDMTIEKNSALTPTGYKTYTPTASASGGTVTVTPSTTTSYYVASSTTGGGSTNTPTAVTLPTMSMTVSNEVLTLTWSAGSVTAGTAAKMPTFASHTIATGITSAAITTEPTITVDTIAYTGAFSPTTESVDLCTGGTVGQPEFTGTSGNVTVS